MITLRRLTLGEGYRYLMSSIAVGDGRPDRGSPLTRYYAESGTPPGIFLGGGLADLDDGRGVEHGHQVSEEHLMNMLGLLADPVSGQPVGAPPPAPLGTIEARIERAIRRLPDDLSEADREAAEAEIRDRETQRQAKQRVPVAGFDLTFSPSKSVSVAWALADEGTKAVIYECHRRSIDYVLAYAEGNVFHSRSGKAGVVQEDVRGVVAASFTHWDSRTGDPQLHDHVVVWNRARSVSDGQWRTLDSRGLYKSTVMLSELHQGVLADLLTEALGVGWDETTTRQGMTKHEITGVPVDLMAEFSQRRAAIDAKLDELVNQFAERHGRPPTSTERIRLAQQANLVTRQAKQHHSLSELSDGWRERAKPYLDTDPVAFVAGLKDRTDLPPLRADDLPDEMLADLAGVVVQAVAERHSTFSRANVLAEIHRQIAGVRFASPDDRVAVAERTADLALFSSLQITPPELHHTPAKFRRMDGTSRLRPKDFHLFTTTTLLDAEARLFESGRMTDGPTVTVPTVAAVTEANLPGRDFTLSVDQALAVEKIVTSGRRIDVLVGPAGTGKSTTMAGLRAVWEAEHGPGSVVGLAPSAAAAEVLAEELGVECENTAKWLHEHRRVSTQPPAGRSPATPGMPTPQESSPHDDNFADRWSFRPGQLVIVDEASLAGTFALDELASAGAEAGAKLLLVGDPHQLSAVEAGGAFSALVRDRGDLAPELTDVRRFTQEWERAASVELRLGDESAIDAYEAHGRVVGGDRDELIESVFEAWQADVDAGKTSLMLAGDAVTVSELNRRARANRVAGGLVEESGVELSGGSTAGVGDEIVTRQNNRLLAAGRSHVKNGDRWIVTAINNDGSMAVRRAGSYGEVVLPADYVAEHVELAYATTAYRAQGRTVDTAHALVSPTTTREVLYVSATRGRESNQLYVDTHYDPDPETGHGTGKPATPRQVLETVLGQVGADRSATETWRAEWAKAEESISTLHAEYQTLAAEAQRDRWNALLDSSGLSEDALAAVRASDAIGPLFATFRDAEARGLDPAVEFPAIVAAGALTGAHDPAAVLHARMQAHIRAAGTKRQAASNLVAGLFPRASGVTNFDMDLALRQRDEAIEARARSVLADAQQRDAAWVRRLGRPPEDPALRVGWDEAATTVAAYRELHGFAGKPTVIGSEQDVHSIEQLGHYKRAQAAVDRAIALSKVASQGVEQPVEQPIDTVPVASHEGGITL